MELHILKEKETELLSRKRVTMKLDNEGATPSRLELLKAVAKKLNVKEELVVIKHIYPQFGSKSTKLIVHVYQDKDKMSLFEHGNLLGKHKAKEAQKEGATA